MFGCAAGSDRQGATLSGPVLTRTERAVAAGGLGILAALRVAYVFRQPFNSDEPQHLHVVWGWTHGLVQYRDVFDNHMPLFHLASVPLIRLAGEHPATLFVARAAMLPLFALSVLFVHAIACALFDRRTGLWAAVLAAGSPGFFVHSVEYRPDIAWTVVWLLALYVLVRPGAVTVGRSAVAGLLLGTALGISVKTIFMLLALGLAAPAAVYLGSLGLPPPRVLLARIGAGLAGLLAVPLAITGLFIAKHALGAFLYGVVWHHAVRGLGLWGQYPLRVLWFPPLAVVLMLAARFVTQTTPDRALGARRALVFLALGLYTTALLCLSPFVEPESELPIFPLLTVFAAPVLLAGGARVVVAGAARPWLGGAIAVSLEIGIALGHRALWQRHKLDAVTLVSEVLQITAPGDAIMDIKGETVFRPRPYFYALEEVTLARIRMGLIPDDIAEHLVSTGTFVAVGDSQRFPPRARAFLNANYLVVGQLRVAGRVLNRATADERVVRFEVAIPGPYALLDHDGRPAGALDGEPYRDVRFLAAGMHTYLFAPAENRVVLLWAPAVTRGLAERSPADRFPHDGQPPAHP
jgi:dolichyl-phosphate-mannose-protein mannosyltransferase